MKKRIAKIEKTDSIQVYDKESNRMVNGKMMQRKKKGRLYSLGGNDPPKRARGRLDRLKTVGTFDLGNETLCEVTSVEQIDENDVTPDRPQARRMSANALLAGAGSEASVSGEHRLSYTPGPCRREIQKSGLAKRIGSRDVKHLPGSATSSPVTRRLHSSVSPSSTQPNVPNQHSADDCLEKPKAIIDNRKSRSSSTSTILNRVDGDPKHFQSGAAYKKSPNKHLPATNFIKKSDYKTRTTTITTAIKPTEKSHENLTMQSDIETSAADTIAQDEDPIYHEDSELPEQPEPHEMRGMNSKQSSQDDSIVPEEELMNDECAYKPRKPVLRKSKRIVRTDSELFDEAHFDGSPEATALRQTTRVQIHNAPPNYADEHGTGTDDDLQKIDADTADSHDAHKESSDVDDASMAREPLKSTTTTNSSRNISVDEPDTVFTDSANDLEKMERDYRELARSNLQREYKSDGELISFNYFQIRFY